MQVDARSLFRHTVIRADSVLGDRRVEPCILRPVIGSVFYSPIIDFQRLWKYAVYRRSFSVSVDNGLIFKLASRVSWRLAPFCCFRSGEEDCNNNEENKKLTPEDEQKNL